MLWILAIFKSLTREFVTIEVYNRQPEYAERLDNFESGYDYEVFQLPLGMRMIEENDTA